MSLVLADGNGEEVDKLPTGTAQESSIFRVSDETIENVRSFIFYCLKYHANPFRTNVNRTKILRIALRFTSAGSGHETARFTRC